MKTYSTPEMLHGLEISYPTLKRWAKNEGMPYIRANPWIFDVRALKWVIENKPNKAELAKKMEVINNG